MSRLGLLARLLLIILGFTTVGAAVRLAGTLDGRESVAAAQALGGWLRTLPNPARTGAGGPVITTADPPLPQLAAKEAAGEVQTQKPESQADATELAKNDKANPAQFASRSLANLLSEPSDGNDSALRTPVTTNALRSEPPQPAPAAPSAKAKVAASKPETAAAVPAIRLATQALPSTEATEERAASIADAATKVFSDFLVSHENSEPPPKPADITVAMSRVPPKTDGEPPMPAAGVVADMAFSSFRYEPVTSEMGVVTVTGRGLADRKIAVTLDNQPLGSTTVAENGRWMLENSRGLAVGQHDAKAELLGADGKALLVATYTFRRDAAVLAGSEPAIVPLAMTVATASAAPPVPPGLVVAPRPLSGTRVPAARAPVVIGLATQLAGVRPAPAVKGVTVTRRTATGRRLFAFSARTHSKDRHAGGLEFWVRIFHGKHWDRVTVPDGLLRAYVGHYVERW